MGRIPQVQGRAAMSRQMSRYGGVPGRALALLAAVALVAGCSYTYEKREASDRTVIMERPQTEIAESELLDVRIRTFGAGELTGSEDEKIGLSEEIRNAEGRYAAVQLRRTMQQSGYWGAVRVVPADYSGGDLLVSGRVLHSDGEALKLEVTVTDATGTEWFTRSYEGVVEADAYEGAAKIGVEPFSFLYTQISNDIARQRAELPDDRLAEIRRVAELRFAGEFAPEAFGGYVKRAEEKEPESDGLKRLFASLVAAPAEAAAPSGPYEAVRLPAEDDPMMERVRRIRARENLVVDALDQQYETLSRRMGDAYANWRSARLTEMNALRSVEDQRDSRVARGAALAIVGILAGVAISRSCDNCGSSGAVLGGFVAAKGIQDAYEAHTQASADEKIHRASLEELGKSVETDIEPIVVEVEGETVELRGSADAKFRQWRDVMKRLYEREVGPAGAVSGAPASKPSGGREG